MFQQQIGLNHIFIHNTSHICLACKENITEYDFSDKELVICCHLQSEKHLESIRSLFKTCVPDVNCDSREIKYLDIINNLAFDVTWETGNEASYVCVRGENLVCLLCQENISKVSVGCYEMEYDLFSHLTSDFHLSNVKDKVFWIYHPNSDISYIAFHNCTVFCSFCHDYLKVTEDSVLQTVTDHLEMDQSKMVPQIIENLDDAKDISMDDLCTLFSSLKIDNYSVPDQKEVDASVGTLCHSLELTKSEAQSRDKVEFTRSIKSLGRKFGIVRLNKKYIEIKNDNYFCLVCELSIEFQKDGEDLRTHLYSDKHAEILSQNARNFMSSRKKFPFCLYKEENFQKLESILKTFSEKNKFKSHVLYIKHDGKQFFCVLCCRYMDFAVDGETVKQHFFTTKHINSCYRMSCNRKKIKNQFLPKNTTLQNAKLEKDIDKDYYEIDNKSVDDVFLSTDVCNEESTYTKTYSGSRVDCVNNSTSGASDYSKLLLDNDYDEAALGSTCLEENSITCLECGKSVEIWNGDQEFSLELHSHTHKSLTDINNQQFLCKNSSNDSCPQCGESLDIFNKDYALSLDRHLEDCPRRNDKIKENDKFKPIVPFENVKYDGDSLFDKAFVYLSEDFNVHRKFIVTGRTDFYCKLCDQHFILPSSFSLSSAINTIQSHLSDSYHKLQFQAYNQNTLLNKQVECDSFFKSNTSNKTIVNDIVENSPQVIIKQTKENISAAIPRGKKSADISNISSLPEQFTDDSKENLELIVKNAVKKNCIVALNKQYLNVVDSTVFCEVCQKAIRFVKDGSKLISHCSSNDHNEILWKITTDYTSGIRVNNLALNNTKFRDVMLELENNYPFNKVKSLIQFIEFEINSVVCNLCTKPLKFSKNGCSIIGHFFSKMHVANVYELSCSYLAKNKKGVLSIPLSHQVSDKLSTNGNKISQLKMPENSITAQLKKTGKLEVPFGKRRPSDQVLHILERLSNNNLELKDCFRYVGEKEGHFYCEVCCEGVRCTLSGKELIKHINEQSHKMNLLGKSYPSTSYDSSLQLSSSQEGGSQINMNVKPNKHLGKSRQRSDVLSILEQLTKSKKEVKDNMRVLGEKGGHFYCEVCCEGVRCTLSGKELIKHINEQSHKMNLLGKSYPSTSYDSSLQLSSSQEGSSQLNMNVKPNKHLGKSRQRSDVLSILEQLTRSKKEVKDNMRVLGEKGGHFYCEVCCEGVSCTLSGKELIKHINEQSHKMNQLGKSYPSTSSYDSSLQLSASEKGSSRLDTNVKLNTRLGKPCQRSVVLSRLEKFTRSNNEVKDSIMVLGEKEGHFYCEVCCKSVSCTRRGKDLLGHLKGKGHLKKVLEKHKPDENK